MCVLEGYFCYNYDLVFSLLFQASTPSSLPPLCPPVPAPLTRRPTSWPSVHASKSSPCRGRRLRGRRPRGRPRRSCWPRHHGRHGRRRGWPPNPSSTMGEPRPRKRISYRCVRRSRMRHFRWVLVVRNFFLLGCRFTKLKIIEQDKTIVLFCLV